MKQYQKAGVAGTLFLIALAASIAGGSFVQAVASQADPVRAALYNRTPLLIGILLELVNAVCVAGIAALLYPVLKERGEGAARGYLLCRMLEAVFCAAIVIAPLTLMHIANGTGENTAAAAILLAARAGVTDLLIPVFFSMGAVLFNGTAYRYRLLPRFIPAWGMAGAVLVFAISIFGLFRGTDMNMGVQMALGLPIILNELLLGIWLIAKGFRTPESIADARARLSPA